MSDEFNGESIDFSKWDNKNPQWKGRALGLFTTDAVIVSDGKLIITADLLDSQQQQQNPGFTQEGGLVRSKNKATYGYY